jgi:cytochrome P450
VSDSQTELFDGTVLSDVRDPYPMFAAMRRSQRVPCVDVQGLTFYLLLRYEDVAGAFRTPDVFSSRIMHQVMGPVMGRTILEMDGREHTTHRGLVSHAFRPQSIERYGQRIVTPLVDELVDKIQRGGGRAELVSQLTSQYPLIVIAKLLGVPIDDYGKFQRWSLDIIGFRATNPAPGLAASRALKEYMAPVVALRRTQPQDDLISELVQAEVDGHRLTDEEIFGFLLLLLPAGAETTFRLLGNTLYALLKHPEALDLVRRDRSHLNWALEETLRWEPPLLGTARMTTRAVKVGDVEIPADARVSIMMGPANHDEDHYNDPDSFDIHRHADDHLSFGLGKHFCLGYHLARLEVTAAVNAVLDRLPNLRLDQEQECWIQGVSFRSPNRLPILFD